MNKTDLILMWRNLWKNSSFTSVNIFGLSISLAVGLLISAYLNFEFSFDRTVPSVENTYRLLTTFKYPNSPESTNAMSSMMMGPYLQRTCVDVEDYLRVIRMDENILCRTDSREFTIDKVLQVDSSFFNFFDHRLIVGDHKKLFARPENIVLTKALAESIFGQTNPIDQTIEHAYTLASGIDTTIYFTVSGVLDFLPDNSHLQYDALCGIDEQQFADWNENRKWHGVMANTYLHINQGMKDLGQVERNFASELEKEMPNSDMIDLSLQSMSDIHTESSAIAYDYNNYLKSNRKYLLILGLVALFILIIGAVNFANLSTVLSLKRSQEVGVRKTLGASKRSVIWQFLRESLLMTILAGVLALVWAEIFRQPFLTLLGRDLDIHFTPFILGVFLLTLIIVGFMAGIYPAIHASRTSTSEVLQDSRTAVSFKKPFVQYLVVLQFVLSGILIIGSIISYQQLFFLKNKDLGFQVDQVVQMEIGGDNWMRSASFKRELAKIPGVISVSGSDNAIGTINSQNGVMVRNEETRQWENYPMSIIRADNNFFDLFGMTLVEGRSPTPQGASSELEYIVNETFVKRVGWKQSPIGHEIIRSGMPEDMTGKVVGVIKDVHHNTLRHSIEPLCIQASDFSSIISLKIDPDQIQDVLASIQTLWTNQIKDRPFDYQFMDEQFASNYESESRLGKALFIATILSIIIASLGLLALSSFVINQRTREIGIRKVLGASVASVVGLLSKDFLRLVVIALVIASPIAWMLMNEWLQDFAYHVKIQWTVFLVAGVLAVFAAFVTIGIQSVRAALSNPVESLRNK